MMDTPAAIDTLRLRRQGPEIAVDRRRGPSPQAEVVDRIDAELPDGTRGHHRNRGSPGEPRTPSAASSGTFRTFLTVFAADRPGSPARSSSTTPSASSSASGCASWPCCGPSAPRGGQVMASVVVEAAVIGLVASVLGLRRRHRSLAVLLQSAAGHRRRRRVGRGAAGHRPRTIVVSVVGRRGRVGAVQRRARAGAPVGWPPSPPCARPPLDGASRSRIRLGIGGVLLLGGIALLIARDPGHRQRRHHQAALGTVLVFSGTVVLGPFIVPPLTVAIGFAPAALRRGRPPRARQRPAQPQALGRHRRRA